VQKPSPLMLNPPIERINGEKRQSLMMLQLYLGTIVTSSPVSSNEAKLLSPQNQQQRTK
jgi:hypothetical protein